MTHFQKVLEFHEKFGVLVATNPQLPSLEIRERRCGFIDEENRERHAAEAADDIVEIADSLTDLLYVIYGAALEYGIDIDACFDEVHRSNMSKTPGANGGKAIKGEGYFKPNLRSVLGIA